MASAGFLDNEAAVGMDLEPVAAEAPVVLSFPPIEEVVVAAPVPEVEAAAEGVVAAEVETPAASAPITGAWMRAQVSSFATHYARETLHGSSSTPLFVVYIQDKSAEDEAFLEQLKTIPFLYRQCVGVVFATSVNGATVHELARPTEHRFTKADLMELLLLASRE